MGTPAHRWRFFRAGGLDQVRIESGADIANLDQLDQKLWVALACPVKGLEFDEKTLALIDVDGDGRVRVPEILTAIAFCRDALKNLDGLIAGTDAIPLASIDDSRPAGQAILASARRILGALGKPSAPTVSLAEIADTAAIFAVTRFNGDGIITVASTDDAALAQVITDALATVTNETDRSSKPGISQVGIDAFFEQLTAFDAWIKASESARADIFPLGDATADAAAALTAVRAKVDDYFSRCRLAAYDPRAQASLDGPATQYDALLVKDLSATAAELANLPLSGIVAGRPLPLTSSINPAWSAAVAALEAKVVAPLLGVGRTALTEEEWATVQAKLAPHLAWAAAKPATKADALGIERVRAILASNAKAELTEAAALDKSYEGDFNRIADIEKLARFHRDLGRLLNNFVTFSDFYGPDRPAVFQAGTLFLDSRACELCVRVGDAGKHAALAGLAKCYIAYCDCVRPSGEKMQIAAVFSGGDSDFLMVGRNGLFYDRKGRDWDATITKVVENPISLREAFYSPYKKFIRFVEEQVAKRAAAAETANTGKLSSAAEATAHVDKAAGPPKPGGIDLGSIALIGVAVSGAAAVIGGLLQAFFGLGIFMPIGLAALVLAISGPSMLIAGLKLRQRNLGPILDANGWAINGRVKVNIPFGGSLTQLPTFPEGSQRSMVDSYRPEKSPWVTVSWVAGVVALLAGITVLAYHQGWMPHALESKLGFLGVPSHLVATKEKAQGSVTEAQAVLTSAQEQQTAAKATYDGLVATALPEDPKLIRARSRLERADAKLARAEDKLDRYEARLERATEKLDIAVDAKEARIEAAEAAEAAAAEAAEAEEARIAAEEARVAAAEAARIAAEEAAKAAEPALVDPATGLPIDPTTGHPIDPGTDDQVAPGTP